MRSDTILTLLGVIPIVLFGACWISAVFVTAVAHPEFTTREALVHALRRLSGAIGTVGTAAAIVLILAVIWALLVLVALAEGWITAREVHIV